MRALITGSEGFLGRHLIKYLRDEGYEVWAAVERLEYAGGIEAEKILKCDVRVTSEVDEAIGKSSPEVIYHLAAQSSPTLSWKIPQLTLEINAVGTVNIFESVIKNDLDPIVVVACSSAEYGIVSDKDLPVKETHPLQPLHPYGVSKVAQDLLTYQYYENNGIKGVRARIFNTTGPGKVNDALSEFSKQVVEFRAGKIGRVQHGNLKTRRDITDVRDMIRALKMCENVKYGDAYNICSMKAYRVLDLLNMLITISGCAVKTEYNPALARPTDEPIILGDNRKFVRKTGWKPRISIQKSLEDMLDYWGRRV